MGNFLKNNQKTNIRYKDEDIIFYEPTEEQYGELVKIIEESSEVKEDLTTSVDIGIKYIRYIFRELTSMGAEIDDVTDEELGKLLRDGNRKIVIFYREIEKLMSEILEDIQYKTEQQINMMSSFINIINSNNKQNKLKEKMDRFLNKYKINLNMDELIELKELINNNSKSERVEELLNKVSKTQIKRK